MAFDQNVFQAQLSGVLEAAAHWNRMEVPPDHCAVLTNWLFEENRVAGDPGIVRIKKVSKYEPGPFKLASCTFRRCDLLPLADLIVQVINDEVDRDESG